jgi:hypothetical protein
MDQNANVVNMTKRNPVPSRLITTAVVSIAAALLAASAPAQSAASSGAVSNSTGQTLTAKAAAPVAAPTLFQIAKPAWLTDFSLGVKEGYDDNVFLVSGDGAKQRDSWITTISPKVGFNFAPLFEGQEIFQILSFGYAPDIVTFHDQSTESYTAHRFANTVKGKVDAFSFNLENGFNYIDGSKVAPTYAPPDDTRSAYATGVPRERRAQYQDRAKASLQYDWEKWFVRPTASLLYYNLLTDLSTASGYQNYADRYDVNGGADVGYKLNPQMSLTLGYRYGHQYQQQFPLPGASYLLSSSSDYQRALLGLEGKPWSWLTIALQGGPDFRTYEPNTTTHITPVSDRYPVKYYGEAALIAVITPKDTLTFKYKQWQWVSSTGKLPYFDSLYDLSYRRKLCKSLALDLGGRLQTADYNCGNVPSSLRNDWQYTVSAGLTYSLSANVVISGTYGVDFGRNHEDNVVNPQYRQFTHQLGYLGVTFKF